MSICVFDTVVFAGKGDRLLSFAKICAKITIFFISVTVHGKFLYICRGLETGLNSNVTYYTGKVHKGIFGIIQDGFL